MEETRKGEWAVRVAGGLVFLATFLFYLLTTGQHSFWLDSMEFATVARQAGVPHPPGTPLYAVLSSLATLLPVGAVPFRLHLFDALLGAASAWLLMLLCLEAARRGEAKNEMPPPFDSAQGRHGAAGFGRLAGAAAIALAFAVSPAIWFQSVRAEVYALQSALCLGMVLTAIRWSRGPNRRGALLVLALLAGLGLANHHFLTLLTLACCLVHVGLSWFSADPPGALLGRIVLSDSQTGSRGPGLVAFSLTLLFGLLGLLTYAYLPIRAADGWLMWGDPRSPRGLLSILTAEAFHVSITELPRAPFLEALFTIFEKWIDLLGLPLFLGGFLGLAVLLAKNRRMGVLLLLLVLAGATSKAIMYLDVENPDDHAYFLIGLQAVAASCMGLFLLGGARRTMEAGTADCGSQIAERTAGTGGAVMQSWLGWLRRPALAKVGAWAASGVVVAAAALSGALLFSANLSWCDMSRFAGPDTVNRRFVERIPPDALFLPSYYATWFNHLYFRTVEQRRPDLIMVHQSFYSRFGGGEAYASDVIAEHPETAPLFEEYAATGTFPTAALLALAKERAVLLENDTMEITLPDPELHSLQLGSGGLTLPVETLLFNGPGLLLQDSRDAEAWEADQQRRFWTNLYSELETSRTSLHPELAKLLVWYHYRNALHFVNKKAFSSALLEVRMAERLKPEEARLFELDGWLSKKL